VGWRSCLRRRRDDRQAASHRDKALGATHQARDSSRGLTAAALSEGRPVPAQPTKLPAKNPVPFMPFALWRWIHVRFGGKGFEQEAARNGISKDRLLDRPYTA
jgi:hypothetical protein